MEQGGGADEIGACLQGDTALGLDVFEFVDAGEMPVGQHRVGQRPQVLRGLQLGGVGRQEQQMDVLGHAQPQAFVPAGTVEHEDDLFGRTGADLTGEGGQLHLEERDTDGGGQTKDGAPRGGMDEADEVTPVVAVLHRGRGPLPVETPDLVQDGLEANAVLIRRPELDLGVGEGGRDRLDERP